MNFLAPWFLLGTLAVAGPVLFHLIRRSARDRVPFSSLLFLHPTPPRATRRRKLEDVILLVLRCLGVILLAACFARPFFPKGYAAPPPADEGRRTIVLIDTSASMRRAGLWDKARAAARRHLEGAAIGDRVAVMTFDQQPQTVVSFADWSGWQMDQRAALAQERLDAISPTWAGTHLGLALTTAAELASDNAAVPAHCDIALITDLQEGARLDGLQGYDWPKGIRVIIEKVDPDHPGNAGVGIVDAATAQPRVRVVNARVSTQDKFLLGWDGGGKPGPVYLPPGQARTLSAPALPDGAATGALRLTGGEGDFDNTAWFVAPQIERATIVYFGSESANDSQQLRYYLQRAFPDTPQRQVEVAANPSADGLSRAAFAVIPASLHESQVQAVRQWIDGGKTALLVLTNADTGPTLAALAGRPDIQVSEALGDYALLGEIDFTHPIFAPFSDPRFSDFSHIHFWKHRVVTLPQDISARVLAKFDDESPALVQIPMGRGNLLVLAAGWNPADSQLAVSSKFLPLMQIILDWSGGARTVRTQFEIGDAIPSPAASGDAVQWRKPDGKVVLLPAGAAFTATDLPGIYTLAAAGKTSFAAVNLPLDELRTAPMSPDDLARLGVPLQDIPLFAAPQTAIPQRRLAEEEIEARQKIWRWVIVGLLGIALSEVVLGGWLAGRIKTWEVTP
jgi:hypothetical protein